MFRLLLIPFLFLIISFFYTFKLDKPLSKTIVLSFFSTTLIIYIFGLFNHLKLGVYFIYFITFILFIYNLIYIIKEHKLSYVKKELTSPGFIIFVIISSSIILVDHGKLFSNWDEFSHWGDVVKAMYDTGMFSTSSISQSAFQSYPPFMSLFQYLCVSIYGKFSEGLIYTSYAILVLSLFIPFIKIKTYKKNIIKIISISLIVFLVPMIFCDNYYSTIFIDSALGLLFGYIMASLYVVKDYDRYTVLNTSLALIALVLFKDVGLMLAVIALLCLFINLILNKKISFKKKIILFLIPLISLIFAKTSWSLNISLNHANILFSNPISLKDVINLIIGKDHTYHITVVSNYFKELFSFNAIFGSILNFSFIATFIIISISLFLMLKKNKQNKYNIIILYIGFITYIIGLAFIYCFKFDSYEALKLASWYRYISIYLNGILMFMILSFLYCNPNYKKYVIVLIAILLVAPYSLLIKLPRSSYKSQLFRISYQKQASIIKSKIGDGSIFIISQCNNGFDYWIFKYELRPNLVDRDYWSFGDMCNEEDVWTQKVELNDLYNKIKGYNYVYIYDINNDFIDKYGALFITMPQEKTLYKMVDNKLEKVN